MLLFFVNLTAIILFLSTADNLPNTPLSKATIRKVELVLTTHGIASSMDLGKKSVREVVEEICGLPGFTGTEDGWAAGCGKKISELLESIDAKVGSCMQC